MRLRVSALVLLAPVLLALACGQPAAEQDGPDLEIERAFPNLSFDEPAFLTHAGDGSDRLFVLEQEGVVRVFPNDEDADDAEVFLDIEDRVNMQGSEEGLLGLAFDPEFAQNGRFYVYYSADGPRRSVLSRFIASDPASGPAGEDTEAVLLEVDQPYGNHNGGMIAFGPDGHLYVALGDGGSGGDPEENGQDLETLLGSILRIDVRGGGDENQPYTIPADNPFVDTPDAQPEIWAYGFRNPWRFSFDPESGLLWVGDVGQNAYEEVDLVRAGGNYGWNIMEGTHCFDGDSCDQTGLELPLVDYPLEDGNCAVTGGYVYQGASAPSLAGAYVYGDFCSGRVWALRNEGQEATENELVAELDMQIPSFGVDAAGELYLLGYGDGRLYRFVEDSEQSAASTGGGQGRAATQAADFGATLGIAIAIALAVGAGTLYYVVRVNARRVG